jgi:hypothetical protein
MQTEWQYSPILIYASFPQCINPCSHPPLENDSSAAKVYIWSSQSISQRPTLMLPSTSVFQVDVSEEGFFTRILRALLVSPILATTKAHQSILTILKDLIRHEVDRRVISKIITHLPFTFLSVFGFKLWRCYLLATKQGTHFTPKENGCQGNCFSYHLLPL